MKTRLMVPELGQGLSVSYLMTQKSWWTKNNLKVFPVVYNLDTHWIAHKYHANSQFTIRGPQMDQSGEHAIVGIGRSQVKYESTMIINKTSEPLRNHGVDWGQKTDFSSQNFGKVGSTLNGPSISIQLISNWSFKHILLKYKLNWSTGRN